MVEVVGYSERGMVNALFYEIAYSDQSIELLQEFLSWCNFQSPNACFADIKKAKVIIEPSLSGFGEPDVVILLDREDFPRKQVIFVEAKVKTGTSNYWKIRDEWGEFERQFDCDNKNTSNLFVQLFRKMRFVEWIQKDETPLESDQVLSSYKIGQNKIVLNVKDEVSSYCRDENTSLAWYLAIVPDLPDSVSEFFADPLAVFNPENKSWNTDHWGYLCWKSLLENIQDSQEWVNLRRNFKFNKQQIMSEEPTGIEQDTVYELAGRSKDAGKTVWVSSAGKFTSRVVPTWKAEDEYFPESLSVSNKDLVSGSLCPSLPRNELQPQRGRVYRWSPLDGQEPWPKQEALRTNAPFDVLIIKPSSLTCRVVNDSVQDESNSFLVYTHHLMKTDNPNEIESPR